MKIKITLSLLGFLIVGGIFTGQAQLKNSFDVRYSETLRGNFTTIANNNMSRTATSAYTGEDGNHNFQDNVYVDIDSDVTTFNSSSASLSSVGTGSCVSIRKVYLYWTAGDKEPGDRNSSDNQPNWNYNQVKLKLPRQTAYTTVTADEVLYRGRTEHFSNDPYACVKDITSLVQGIGDYTGSYTVANVEAKTGTIIGHQGANGGDIIGASAGWQIVVVYENTNLPARNVTIFDGFANVTRNNGENNYDIRVEGFRTIPVGAVNADVVFGALEGDRDLTGDRLQIRNASNSYTDISTALRPEDNFFNSKITRYGQDVTNRVPASTNTLGFDAGVFTLNNPNNSLLGNDQTSTILRLTSTQETYSLYMVGLAVEVYEPELSPLLLTTNLGAQNELIIDQTVRATFQVKNFGNDDMKNLSISYVVPSSVNYVPNASLLPAGVTVNYVAGTRTLNFGFADNIVEVGDAVLSVGFDLKASSDCSLAGTQFNLQLNANYRGVKNTTQKTTLSSSALSGACPVGNLQPSRITLVASGACKPTAVNDSASTQVDSPLNIDVVINDNFGGDGPASQAIVVASNPSNGTAVVDTNGTPNDPTDDTILYTPALGYVGSDSFTYTIKDANGDTSTATVDVTVSNVIVTPPGQRNCDCAPFYQNSNFVNPVKISGTNLQPGAVYRFSNVFTDSPSPIDALVKIVKFNNGASLLNIDVAGQGVPANFQPQIKSSTNGDQSVEFEITFVTGGGNYGNEVVISFFGTPFDIDGDSQRTREYAELSLPDAYYQSADTRISIQRKIGSVRGTAINPTTAPGGDISSDARYTFSNYWEGKSKLNYTIGKENGNSDRYYSLALKNANYANPQSTIVTAPVICGNVSDEGGDPLRGVKVNITGTDGSSATLSTDINGNYRYQTSIPSALVDVTYTITETDLENYVSISDADGGPDFNKITRVVNLMSTCQNNFVDDGRPLAQDDAAQASPLRPIQPVNIRVLENDIFGPDGPSTGTITIVSQPAVGSAVVNNSGTPNDPTDDFITYNPPLLNLVPVQLTYQICDSDGDCDTAVVRIGILDDSPRAQDDQYTVSEDSQNNPLTVLVNDDFGNDGPGSLSVVSGPSNGTLTPNNNGTPGDLSDDFFTYTPNADYFGNDLFTYQICDADSPISDRECSTATVRILVAADPTLSVQPVQVVEGQPLQFVFTISDVSTEDVVIQVNTSDVSATAGLDYTAAVNQIITIPAGQLTANYVVNSLEDIIYENSEVFNIQGSVQTNNTRNLTVSTTGTITDNDGAAPTITIADVTVAEGVDAVFVVTLDKPSYEDIVVDITFADGTATNPEDYTDGTPLQVTIPAGQTTSGPITFPTVDDALFEVNENFTVTGTVASGTTAAPNATGTGTITDNDGAAPTITIADVTVAEGADAVFVVTLDKPSYEDIVVDITFADGTATNPEDYTDGTPLQVTIPAGQTTSGPITFPTVDDALFEVNENFTVTGTVASGTTAAPSATGTGTITDNDGAAPTITIADVTVAEGVDAVFVVTLDKPSYEDIVVDITFADGTATNPEDYTDGTPLQVTIPAGQTTSGPITFPTVDDALFEVAENFTVTGTVASGTTAAPNATGTGTITDNDGAAPTITIADVTVAEGVDAVFVVTLDKPSYEDIVVDITFADGTATNPEDYTDGTPLQVTIPAGQTTSGPITFPTVDDALFEVDENFTVTGTVASGTTAAPGATGTGTITDNDGAAPTITIADVTVAEGVDAVFVVTLDKPSYEDIVVDITFADGTATNPEDYTDGTPLQVTIPAGQTTSGPITFPTVDDALFEVAENFTVTGTVASGTTAAPNATGTGTITDNDGAAPTITIADVTVAEGVDAVFVVTLDKPSYEDIVVDITFADGTATNPEDYTDGTPLQVTIPAGQTTSGPITFPTVDDALFEVAENFTVTGTVASGTTAAPNATGTGTITDNDGAAPTITIADVTVAEGADAVFVVTLDKPSYEDIVVDITFADGTATNPEDYTDGTPLQVTIPAGQTTSGPITFPTVDDALFEVNENFTVTGTVASGTTAAPSATGTGTITDNDGAAPTITIADVTVAEGVDAVFVVTLDKPSYEDIVVDITFADGTATNPEDYTDGTPLQVTIPAGQTTSGPITFPTVDDALFEVNENFTVTGTVASGTTAAPSATGTGTITDNDGAAPTITIADVTVAEGVDAVFVVTLDKPSYEDIVVDITFADGTATNPEDYTDGTPLQVTIPAGQTTSGPITFPTVDDALFEVAENFTVTGTVASGTTAAPNATGTGTITDNDGAAPTITIADVTVAEGVDAVFVVTLDKPSYEDIVVDITFADGTATNPEDYTDGTPLQVTIPAGQTTSGPITFPTVDDALFEVAENFTVTGTVASGTTAAPGATGTGTITDNDGAAPTITIADVTVAEGVDAVFVVTLDKPSYEDIVVDITFADGTATNPEDYTDGTPLQVTIPAGQTTSGPITFPTVDDALFEVAENFTVTGTVASGTTAAPNATGTGTITDNDGAAPTITIADVTVAEGADAVFVVTLDKPSYEDIVVDITFADGTATNPEDYTDGTPLQVTIPAGQTTSGPITFPTVDDALFEVAENFTVTGTVASGTTTAPGATGTGTITDNDGAAPTITIADVTVAEGVDAVFVVTLDKPSYEDIVVDITFADGTATNPEDYTDGTPLQVTIPAGQTTSGPITFPTVDDALFEVAENFTVTGTVASGTTAAPSATGTGTITDNDGAAPTITIADVTVAEGADAVFVVTLDKPSYEDIVVDITFADGTATNPEDYTDGTPLQVTIPAGQTTSGPITFPTVDDALFEVAENFTVTGTVASGTTTAPGATGTGTITDNDGAAPTITIADVTVAEGVDAVFVVTLDKPSYEDIVVDITFADGTATNPEDYTDGTPLQVTIPAGQTTSGPITFPTVDDALFEVNENFTVTGTVASGTTAAPSATGTGTITDNDGAAPTITIADVTVAEGADAVFVVTLDKPSYEDIVVDITFADGTATNPEDYTDGTPLQVTIPAGQTTSGPITFPTVDDALFEVNENFTVTGTVASGTTAAPNATGTGTITDNDGAAPTITIADVTVAEGADAVFVVTLDKPSYEDIVVDITFADGTATNPEDYTDGTPLQVTIPAGQTTSGPITFPTVDDALFEVNENFTVTGTVASGTTAAPNATGTGTITDNDGAAPTITIADVTVAEGVDAVFVVTLDKPSYEDIVVDITFADGTATNPEDYTDGTPLQVTIPAGQTTSGPITFPTVDDALFEVDENFTVTGTVASGTTAAPNATGTGTITDNDGAAPTITIADVTVAEGVDAVFVVTLDKPSYEDIVVDITFADGTATNPEDYTDGTPLQVTIPAGQTTSGPITFPTVDDALFEVNENFTVTGTVASGTTAAPSATGTGTITDNDGAAPTITIADVTVAEGVDAVFVVTLDKPSYEDIVVDITFADGTATNPEDYTDGTPLQVIIPAGQTTSGPITFPTVDDALFEVDENFTVTGTVASGTTAAPSATGTGTITDNDGAAPTITIADVTVAEGVDAVFVVTLDKPSYEDIVVDITFADGTATNPEDYTDGTPLQVTIPAGQTTSGPITFPTVDDALFEVAENFTVTGTVASGTTAAPSATGTGTITDNDGAAPTITIADVTVAEGVDAVFVVTLDKPSYEDIVVDITFADGTATNPEDYTDGTPLQVTIPAGQTTSGPITFPTVDDALFEINENFTVTGTVASGTTAAPNATGTGTITDNDGAAPTITIADVTVAEGADAVFVVTLDKPSYEDIVVDITFADGTATNPEDYTDGTPLQVTIPAGQTTSGPITFPTVDDALFEVNENFTVTGTVASGTTAAPNATGTGTITDNDGAAPTITIADVTVAEGADAVFVVTLDKPSYEDIVVDITFADGTATNPEDYTDGTPLQVTIPAGQTTSGPITFPTVDDALFEVNENFTVTGTVASGTTAAPSATGTGTITDNDGAAPTITIADVTVAEGVDAVFVVTLDKPSYEDIVVDITFADGTATNPEDYTDGTPLQVTIPAGQTTSGPITFPTVDDALFEVNENFTVTGTVASGTTAAPSATGTGTITDNDGAAPTITIADVTVAEGVDAVFVVTLDKPSYEDIVVDITFADGTATNPEDYTDGTPLQVTIPAGQTTSGPITFPTVDDALFEVDENFTVTGTVASGTTAAPSATGTGTITDNDGAAPTITIADVTVAEGADAVFVVTLDKPSYEDIVVDITFADGTATNPEDYTDGIPLQVTIPAGQTTSGPITFPTVDDALFEVDENFTVTGTVASGTTAAPSATGTGTITDNDGAAPTITIADVTVAEGADAVFVVTLDKPSYEDIVVDITFADGTATNPEDYTDGTPLQVTIPAGQTTSGPITFPTVDDALFEVDENFTVTGTVASGTTAAPSATGTGTITDNDGAAPTITIADVTVAEGADAVFVVTLDKPSYEDIVVDITFADGTATNPEDYTDGIPLQVTIPAGQTTSGPITFPTVDDALFEVDENFTVTGTVASGTTAAPSATGTGTITDNDGAAPTITIADVTVAEGVDAVFVVTLDKPSYEDIVVDITFADGTATNPEDYTDGTPLQVTIPAGQTTSGPITFPTVDDALFEVDENFTVTGTVASGTTAAPNATGTGTITDNDGAAPTITIADVTVAEGVDAVFVVTLDKPSYEDIVVDITFADGTATNPEDYTDGTPLQVTIPAGQTTSGPITFPTVDDALFEVNENFTVTGTVASGTTAAPSASGTGTITDNDGAAPTITIADVTVAEGADAVFVVTLDKPSYEDIVVDITFADGTATNPEDYTDGTPLQVTIPAGQTTSGPITFPTVDDALFEVDENFTVTGTVASGTTAAPSATGTGTITDNDGAAPTITIADVTVAEGVDAVFVVTLDKPSYEDIVVDITFADGTATNPEDYTDGTPLQVTIPAGQTTSGPITFPTVDDALFEVDENFTVTGTVASGTTAAPNATGTGTITDNDGAAPTITIADVTVAEGADAVFVVTLDKPSYEDIVVDITFADGTATNPEDYTDGTPLQVTIPAGQTTSGPITFPTVDDALFEVNENFTVTGTVASGTTAAPSATGTGTITDNDGAAPTITIADVTVAEGADAVFVVTLDKPSYEDIVVDITFADGTATNPEDYTDGTPLQVTIPAGQTTSGPITFPTVDDTAFEDDETFIVIATVSLGTTDNLSDTATGTIESNEILAINDINDTFVNQAVSGNVGTNDENPDGPVGSEVFTVVTQPTNGTLVFNPDGSYTYTPNADFIGEDTFAYQVCDAGIPQACDSADVTIQVLPLTTNENDPPVANDDTAITEAGTPVDGNVLTNDFDPDGGPLTVTGNTNPTNGTVVVNPDGTFTYTPNPDFTGEDSFEYTVCDNGTPALCDTATVTIEVIADTRNFTVANDDAFFGYLGAEITGNVLTNDSDPEGDLPLAVTGNTNAANGTVTLAADGSLSYVPNAGFSGSDQFTYDIVDTAGSVDTATVYITVDPSAANTILAINDINDTFVNQAVSGNVGTNDENPDGPVGSEVFTVVTQPTNGTLVFNPDGSYTYTPNADFIGEDTFAYQVCDAGIPQACDGADVTIQVLPLTTNENDPPVANDDTAITEAGTPVDGNVLTNDFDPDGGPLTVTGNTNPTNGTVVVNPDGTFTYTPNPDFTGEDSFEYTVCDTGTPALCDTATVTIEVIADTRNFTVANDDAFFGYLGAEITGNVLTNDSDPEGDLPLAVTGNSNAANGTVTLAADGSLSYVPNAGFSGSDQFTYDIVDTAGSVDTATVYITVDPSAANTILAINDINDTFVNQAVSGNVGTNDENPDGPVGSEVFTVVTQPTNGTLVFNPDGSYTYTPNADFIGEDTFAYQVCDAGIPQACDGADVTIQVLPLTTNENDPPVANDDTAITEAGTPVDGNVLTNDFDPDGGPLTVTGNTNPTNGTVVVNPDGTFTYTPNPDFTGEDSFEYTVCDTGTPALCDTATVTIEVIADTRNFTVANDDAFFGYLGAEITGNVLTNDSDPEGDLPLAVTGNTNAANGTVTLAADGSLSYVPNAGFSGSDQFTYDIVDTAGSVDTATVYITVDPSAANTILAINDINDTFVNQAVSGNVGTNDENPDGPVGSEVFTVVTQPTNGTLVFNPDGSYTYTPNADFIGEDTFAYQVCDAGIPQACDSADVTIQVLPLTTNENDPPVANDDTAITEAGTPVDGNVLTNDFDPDGGPLTVTGNTNPTNGTVVVNPDGTFTYTPNPDFTGEDSFEYTVCDTGTPALCDTATVTIEVIADTRNFTVANDDAFFGYLGAEITGNVLTNDSDPEGDLPLAVTGNSNAANGTVTLAADGSLSYVPNAGFSGSDQFTYDIVDTAGSVDTATVYITVDPSAANTILAINDINDTFVNQAVSGNVGTNDENPDGPVGSEVFTVVTQPTNGTLVFNPDGSYTYTPNADFIGEDTFAYQVCDAGIPQACDGADVTIQVLPLTTNENDPPVANDDTAITEAGTPVDGNVLTNDFDPDGGPLTVTGNTNPTNGTVVVNPDGTFTYTPNPDFTGEDSFEYTVCDTGTPALCDTATVTIEVIADTRNFTVANDDAFFGYLGAEITGNVLTNDSDPEGDLPLAVTGNTNAANGTVTLAADGSLSYVPNAGFSGSDQFTYDIVDTAGSVDTATVYITVDPSAANTILAINDINDTFVNQAVSGNVGTNDENSDGPVGSEVFTVVTQPTNGTLVFNPDGSYTYTPNADFIGEDTFAYQVCDAGIPQACDGADVTIQVLPEGTIENNAPVANDDTAITEAGTPVDGNVLANDFDPDGDVLTVTSNTTPVNGTLVINPDGTFIYTPNPDFTGEDSFEYTVCDDNNPSLCDTATVTIDVIANAGNTIVANDDAYFGLIGEVITGNVLTNDSDPEGDDFTVTSNTQPSNGTVVILADGSLTYTPNGIYSGTDQFTYTITDDNGATDTATVYISIDPSPNGGNTILAVTDINDTFVNQPVSGNVGTNDENPDGPVGSEVFTVVTQSTNGTLVFNPDGSYTYTPNTDFIGDDTFTYQICDGGSPQACDTASVYIQVVPLETTQNDPPVANADTNTTEVGVSIDGNVLSNDFDPDGDPITVTSNTNPANGTVVVNPDGSYTYTPGPGFVGEDSFEYTVCDNGNPQACDSAIVIINIIPDAGNITNANDDAYFGETNESISGNVLDNDTDPEGQTQLVDVALSPANGPANGTVVINADGTFIYTPNTDFAGNDQFTYQIFDAGSPVATDTATVYILVSEKPNPEIQLVKTGVFNDENADAFAQVGETITYTFTVTNTGNTVVSGIVIDDAFLGITGLIIDPADLSPGDIGVATASYTITQTDIEAGFVTNSALATGKDPFDEDVTDTSDNGDETVDDDGDGDPTNDPTITNTPGLTGLSVYKFGTWNDEDGDQVPEVGETITYTFTVRNTGETAIFDIVIDDPLVTVTGGPIDLAAGAVDTDTFSAVYVITQDDIENAGVKNQAIGSGVLTNGNVIEDLSDNGDDTVETVDNPDDADGDPTNDPTFTRLDGVLDREDIIVYNVMTPNGDGLNDVFMIQNITDFPNNTVQIFNRWGVEVFSTKGYDPNSDNAFRGFSDGRATVRRGERLPTGTYYYIITYERDSGEIRKLASFLYIN